MKFRNLLIYSIRIHQGFLVNPKYIYSINYDTIELDNGFTLPISRSRTKEVKLKYMRYSRRNR